MKTCINKKDDKVVLEIKRFNLIISYARCRLMRIPNDYFSTRPIKVCIFRFQSMTLDTSEMPADRVILLNGQYEIMSNCIYIQCSK